jgi:hypothetical protein
MMNIYYTAKDIEELAAKGVRRLEVGPGIMLTDFARESAHQLGVELVDARKQQAQPAPRPAAPSSPAATRSAAADKYNRPSGCMHASIEPKVASAQTAVPSAHRSEDVDPNTVNKLIDLVGKAIKRGV